MDDLLKQLFINHTEKMSDNELLRLITEYHLNGQMIFKLDVEGSEYEILGNLAENNLLKKFTMIIGESHNVIEKIIALLQDFELFAESKVTKELSNFCFVNKTAR